VHGEHSLGFPVLGGIVGHRPPHQDTESRDRGKKEDGVHENSEENSCSRVRERDIMRDAVFTIFLSVLAVISARFPSIGLLSWGWISVALPHKSTYGFAYNLPVNLIIAAATFGGLALSKEKPRLPVNGVVVLMVLLFLWTTVTTLNALNVDWSLIYWGRVVKMWLYMALLMSIMRSRVRIHGLIWLLAISIGYYGVKGGAFLAATAGAYRVEGPADSPLADNNILALATVMVIPLMVYLRQHSRVPWVRQALALAMGLSVLSVIGSYSRGGFIALMAVMGMLWLRSHHRWRMGAIIATVAIAAMSTMPPQYLERLGTIRSADQDQSFQGRTRSWELATTIANDRLTGAGFYGPQLPEIYHHYLPDDEPLAAHSIYFQMLGEHGFIGLALFMGIALMSWIHASAVIRQTKGNADWAWAHDLAVMARISLVGYYIGGAALSLAYFDMTWMLWAILANLLEITRGLTRTSSLPRPQRYAGAARERAPV
jgi:putative inorganic carbon (hco3(-)) transporter